MFSKNETSGAAAPAPAPTPAPAKSGGTASLVGNDLEILGNLVANGDIQIDGTVTGDIQGRSLTIGESARIKGSLTGDSVRVLGAVKGSIEAKSIVLMKSARVNGDLAHEDLAIEAGAEFEGGVMRLETKRAQKAVAKAQNSASQEPAKSPEAAPSSTPEKITGNVDTSGQAAKTS